MVDAKGPDPSTIARLAKLIRDTGYSKIVYKSDQEKPLRALLEETSQASMRQGELQNPQLTQMVPEASAVGESQPNGRAENAIVRVEAEIRILSSALEAHLKEKIDMKRPFATWLLRWSGGGGTHDVYTWPRRQDRLGTAYMQST